jgi:hypothetical protein
MPGKDTSQVNNASEAGSSLAAGCNCATCPKNAFDTSSCVCSRVAASRSKFAAERTWDAGESDPQREARFIIATPIIAYSASKPSGAPQLVSLDAEWTNPGAASPLSHWWTSTAESVTHHSRLPSHKNTHGRRCTSTMLTAVPSSK